MRRIPGRTAKEALYKRWVDRKLRNWKCLLRYCGLEISICTRNTRRLRFVDLLTGSTMRLLLCGLPGYAQQPWKDQFKDILDHDPGHLVKFTESSPYTSDLEDYISHCLETLIETGVRSGTDKGTVDNRLCALWSYGDDDMIVAFPPKYYSWTGFFDFESVCCFVVLEKCLVNKFGRICRHPEDITIRDERQSFPAVLEIFLVVNRKARPAGMKKQIRHGRKLWKVDCVDDGKHFFNLNERGRLHGYQCCSSTVAVGKWSKRNLLDFLGSESNVHSEHVYDGGEDDICPLPYLIQEDWE